MSVIKVLNDHTHTAPEWDHYHEMVHVGEHECRDSLGRRNNNGSTRWLVVVCNNPDCKGRVLVSSCSIERLATEAIGGP